MFVNFTRASRKSKTITDLADVEHLDNLSAPDRRRVAELIDAHVAERAAESGRSPSPSPRSSPPADQGNLVERCRALLGDGGRGPRVSLTNGRGETFDVAAGVFASRKRPRPRRSSPGLACWCGAPPDGDVRRCGGACGTWRVSRRLFMRPSPRRTAPPFAGATRAAPARSTRRTASAAAAGARPTPGSAAPARPRSTARTPPRPSPARRSPPPSTPWTATTAPRPRRRAPTTAPRRGPSARGAASTPRGRGASRGVAEKRPSRGESSKIGARRGSSATRPTTTARRRRRSGPARPRRPRYVLRDRLFFTPEFIGLVRRRALRRGPRAHLAGGRAVRRGARAAPALAPGARRGQDHVHPVQPRVRRRGQAPPPARDGDRGSWVARRRVIFATFTTPRRRPQASPPSQRTRSSRSSAPRGPCRRRPARTTTAPPRRRGRDRAAPPRTRPPPSSTSSRATCVMPPVPRSSRGGSVRPSPPRSTRPLAKKQRRFRIAPLANVLRLTLW